MKKTYQNPEMLIISMNSDTSLLALSGKGNYGSGVTVGAPRHYRRGRTGDIYEGDTEEDEDDEEVW
ncbi:MAG: hypothetical protein IJP46_10120 [Prevotella sp.]|jgi:hypothetical protein|nr:hypothetical protein [Prevotella sp.]